MPHIGPLATVTRVTDRRPVLDVEVEQTSGGRLCMVSHPCQVVKIPKAEKPIRFTIRTTEYDG